MHRTRMIHMIRKLLIILFAGLSFNAFADTINNPCAGSNALLSIVDRPTAGDSACAVPFKHVVIEAGYQYQKLSHSAGDQYNLPEAEIRFGLPWNNELVFLAANYIHQSSAPHSGSTASTIGIKHEIGYTPIFVTAAEILVTLPNGSAAFGSKGTGAALNGIISYNINTQFNLTFMLGVTTATQSSLDGGQRFGSINPDLVFTYAPTEKCNLYGEVYGQSKTGPGENNGFNFDGGILYLLSSNVTVDLEVGQRISGNLSGFNHYVGTGLAVMF